MRGAITISTDDNKAVIRRLFDELWGTGDVSAADRFYAPGPQLDGLKQFARDLYVAIPDWRVTIDELVAEDERVVVRWTGRGTSLGSWDGAPPTGLPVTSTGIDIERLVNGMIVEENGESTCWASCASWTAFRKAAAAGPESGRIAVSGLHP